MKWIISSIIVIVLVVGGLFYFNYKWKFGEGVKAGKLNYVVYKGYVFKTYEGKLIQEGFKGSAAGLSIPEFEFSVEDSRIGDSLMRCTGDRVVELHYVEYKKPLVWRGMQKYIVDSIVSVR